MNRPGDRGFPDYFSAAAAEYARFRPGYPEALFRWLAAAAMGTARAWDCGTGNGQAARGLAAHFTRVIATDPSESQLRRALPAEGVRYLAATAEAAPLADASVDLVTAAQAAHWFRPEAFQAEVERVLRAGGVVALWCYRPPRVTPAVDAVLEWLRVERLGPWWPPGREHVDSGYATLAFPWRELAAPAFESCAEWDLERLAGYLGTWSALGRCRDATGQDPLAEVWPQLHAAWGAETRRRVCWPLALRVGRR